MPKHVHLQTMAEQISTTGHGSAPFHYEKTPDNVSKPIVDRNVSSKLSSDDATIQLLAYQIFQEKGGSDLDNWFEAERALTHNY